jgi:hypothetical protein
LPHRGINLAYLVLPKLLNSFDYIKYFALTSSQLIGAAIRRHFLVGAQEMELVVKHNFYILKQSSKIARDCCLKLISNGMGFFVF